MNYFTGSILAISMGLSCPVLAADLPYGRLERTQFNFPSGEYDDPIRDPYPEGQYEPGYLHAGMYCAGGNWHSGFLMPWESAPVIKRSCGRHIPSFFQSGYGIDSYVEHPRDERGGYVVSHRRGNVWQPDVAVDTAQPGIVPVPGGTIIPGAAQDPGCGGGIGQYACPEPKFVPNPPARY